jgi:hypothetical protein
MFNGLGAVNDFNTVNPLGEFRGFLFFLQPTLAGY